MCASFSYNRSWTHRLSFLGTGGGGDSGHRGRLLLGDCVPTTTGAATAGAAAARRIGIKSIRCFSFLGAAGGDRKGQGRLARGERSPAGGAPLSGIPTNRCSGDTGESLFI